jgi:DNA-directed RNA polymerase specialized sigma24 family protein
MPAPSRPRRGRGLDDASFAALCAARAAALLELLERLTNDPRVAVELWAETLAHAAAVRRRYRGHTPEDASAWLETIAYRQLARLRFHGCVEPASLRRLGVGVPSDEGADVVASFLAELLRADGIDMGPELSRDMR